MVLLVVALLLLLMVALLLLLLLLLPLLRLLLLLLPLLPPAMGCRSSATVLPITRGTVLSVPLCPHEQGLGVYYLIRVPSVSKLLPRHDKHRPILAEAQLVSLNSGLKGV